jgi:hypothetical protein
LACNKRQLVFAFRPEEGFAGENAAEVACTEHFYGVNPLVPIHVGGYRFQPPSPMAAAGAGPGRYRLGGEEIVVSADLKCQIPGQPNLAGSALTLDRAVYNVSRYCGVSVEDAWAMASTRPAELVGLTPPSIPTPFPFDSSPATD